MQREICERITQTLATMPVHDHLGYEALSMLKLPGVPYTQVLNLLHRALKPKKYVEIGVRHGHTLFLAGKDTRCIAIDPDPRLPEMRTNVELSVTSSDNFFANPDRCEDARGFDLALIDGDHSFEHAARDFANLERLAGPHSIIAIHDVIPMDERTAQPPDPVTGKIETSFHTGNVWRLMAGIVAYRHDLVRLTIACPPTGLALVGRFNGSGYLPGLGDEVTTWANALPFPADWDDAVEMLNIIPNDQRQWGEALKSKAISVNQR